MGAVVAVAVRSYAMAPHYYDAMQLLVKQFRPWLALDAVHEALTVGRERMRAMITNALASMRNWEAAAVCMCACVRVRVRVCVGLRRLALVFCGCPR